MLSDNEIHELLGLVGYDTMALENARAIEAAVLAKLQAQSEPDQRLVNLLCRIHRDGGHYIADHGIDKAVDDADVLIAELNALRDSAPVQQEPTVKETLTVPVADPVAWHRWYVEDGERGQEFSAYPRPGFKPLFSAPVQQEPRLPSFFTQLEWLGSDVRVHVFQRHEDKSPSNVCSETHPVEQDGTFIDEGTKRIRELEAEVAALKPWATTPAATLGALAGKRMAELEAQNKQLLEALKQIQRTGYTDIGDAIMVNAAIAAVEVER